MKLLHYIENLQEEAARKCIQSNNIRECSYYDGMSDAYQIIVKIIQDIKKRDES